MPKVLGTASVVAGVAVLLLGGLYTLGSLSTHNQATNPYAGIGVAIGVGILVTGLVLVLGGLGFLRLGRRRRRL